MPFIESTRMDERCRFVQAYLSGLYEMSELCQRYSISRPTGYKWVERYEHEGVDGLRERSRRAHRCPHRMSQAVATELLALRRAKPLLGARKILRRLRRRKPDLILPSRSAVNALFKREGLIHAHRARSHAPTSNAARQAWASRPNELWTVDFKGQFRTGDSLWCYPLTVMDYASRFLLGCQGRTAISTLGAQGSMREIFEQFGLPECIHSDNGSPFGSTGLCGLSRLSLHWLKLGIRIQRSRPSKPQDNGTHERMHRTLKAHTCRPPATNLRSQQRRFDSFVQEYNFERSHEALDDLTPAERYHSSPQLYPKRLEPPGYPGHYEVRRVSAVGAIRWRGCKLFIGEAFQHELLGLEEIDEGIWSLYFSRQLLARFHEQDFTLVPLPV